MKDRKISFMILFCSNLYATHRHTRKTFSEMGRRENAAFAQYSKMKQYEAVIQTLERIGGQATLGQLNSEVLKIKECQWKTKTPFASIRRIVQERPEIFKIRPGLWALRSYQQKLGLAEYQSTKQTSPESIEQNHSYYQGLLIEVGNLRGYDTFIPNQDKNRLFINQPLKDLSKLSTIPMFSHDFLVKRSSTIDVIWFNSRQMPNSFFEVEHSTDFQNSLIKFNDLQDFHARMIIVADENKQLEFSHKINYRAFDDIKTRIKFLSYEVLVKQYEYEVVKASQRFAL
jgi:hypothetical protein